MKLSATVIPFPTDIVRKAKRVDESTRHARFRTPQRGTVDAYFGDNGMAAIDACLPTALAIRVLSELKRATA